MKPFTVYRVRREIEYAHATVEAESIAEAIEKAEADMGDIDWRVDGYEGIEDRYNAQPKQNEN